MQIKIDIKVFALLLLFFFTHQIEIYVLLMFFALLHELGHLLAGIILKFKPKKIAFNPLGLSVTFEGFGENVSRTICQKRIFVAIAGPLVNLIIIILTYIFNFGESKYLIIYSNLILLLINLIPIYPLDGGRILKEFLHIQLGYWKSISITNKISNVFTILLTIIASISIFYFKNIAILLIGIYLWFLVIKENRYFAVLKKMNDILYKDKKTLENIE